MDGGLPIFSLLTQRMSWLSGRQSLLAGNVANADTPRYQARDLQPLDFEAMMKQGGTGLAVTNARHIEGRTAVGGAAEITGDGEGTPSGNAVSLESEMIKLSDTQIQYQTAANLYQKAVAMFRTALGGRS